MPSSLIVVHHHLLLLSLILIPLSLHACTARPLNIMGADPSPVQSQSKPQEGMVVLEVKEATSGQEIIVASSSSSHYLDLPKASKTNQGLKRVMLGKATDDDSEEMVDESGEKEGVEDVDVMDYAQPHKKPPIHNEKKH